MKILTVCNLPPPYGGAEVFAKHLIIRLHSAETLIALISHRSFELEGPGGSVLQYSHRPADHADLANRGIAMHPLFTTALRPDSSAETGDFPQRLRETIAAERPDLVHCHFTTGRAEAVVAACESAKVPLVMTLHGMTNLTPMPGSFVCGAMSADQIVALLDRCAEVVVVSNEMLDYCRRRGIQRVCRIPAGVDLQFFSPADAGERSDLLYLGKLNRIKGLSQAVDGFVRIADRVTGRLRLVGRGVDRNGFAESGFFLDPATRERARELIAAGRIDLLGELPPDRVRTLYRSCAALVLPSITEGCPLVVLEALACGMPVVATRVGSIPEIIDQPVLGTLVAPNDIEALSHALLQVLVKTAPGESSRDPAAIRRRSVEAYDISRVAHAYRDMFQRTSGSTRGSRREE